MGTNIVNTKVSQHDDIKQHLSNIWRSIHKKVKQHWGWVEKKKRCLQKKRAYQKLHRRWGKIKNYTSLTKKKESLPITVLKNLDVFLPFPSQYLLK